MESVAELKKIIIFRKLPPGTIDFTCSFLLKQKCFLLKELREDRSASTVHFDTIIILQVENVKWDCIYSSTSTVHFDTIIILQVENVKWDCMYSIIHQHYDYN